MVNASSEEGKLTVNGMSNHDRMGKNSNSAIIVSVGPEDFGSKSPLPGLLFSKNGKKKRSGREMERYRYSSFKIFAAKRYRKNMER